MKHLAIVLLAHGAAAAMPFPAAAQTRATGVARAVAIANAQVLPAASLTHTQAAASQPGGTVGLEPVAISHTCDAQQICTGAFAFPDLRLSGADTAATITFDPLITVTGPGQAILVTPVLNNRHDRLIGSLPGTVHLQFDARMHFNPQQVAGYYVGRFTISLQYD
ncbi:MAG: hypothetical protein RIQ99_2049 [Pseudomonadota bacterium]